MAYASRMTAKVSVISCEWGVGESCFDLYVIVITISVLLYVEFTQLESDGSNVSHNTLLLIDEWTCPLYAAAKAVNHLLRCVAAQEMRNFIDTLRILDAQAQHRV